jgi:hypothetical protein
MKLQRAIPGAAQASQSSMRLLITSQVLAAIITPWLSLSAMAQGAGGGGAGLGSGSQNLNIPRNTQTPTTILPTDVLPLPAAQERMSFGENLQLRVLQRLPAKFYFNTSVETSMRFETNVFQFPHKRQLLQKLLPGGVSQDGSAIFSHGYEDPVFGYGRIFQQLRDTTTGAVVNQTPSFQRLDFQNQKQISSTMALADRNDTVFRVLPNVTAGWAFTPRTRAFANYFMIRDSLFGNVRLNTVIQSVAMGVQHDIPVTRKGNLQLEFQARELFQLKQQPVFDFLPALTFSYILTPRTVIFANTLLQMRGKKYFQAPTKELDPFYTFGSLYQRGGWSLSTTATFVQNFREPFRRNASTPQNNYSWILDFELARRLVRELPGLQAFVRAEPIYNFHSNQSPGLAGQDFRLFYGLRMALGKPPLTAALEQIRQQLEEQETAPPGQTPPGKSPSEPKPSAFLMPYQVTAGTPQPIHGVLPVAFNQTHETGSASASNWVLPDRPQLAAIPLKSITGLAPHAVKPPVVARNTEPKRKGRTIKPATAKLIAAKPITAKPEKKTAPVKEIAATESPAKELSIKDVVPKEITKQLAAKEAVTREIAKELAAKDASTKQAKQIVAKKSNELQMILMAPLPTVHPEDKENPFGSTGDDMKPPVMVVR